MVSCLCLIDVARLLVCVSDQTAYAFLQLHTQITSLVMVLQLTKLPHFFHMYIRFPAPISSYLFASSSLLFIANSSQNLKALFINYPLSGILDYPKANCFISDCLVSMEQIFAQNSLII